MRYPKGLARAAASATACAVLALAAAAPAGATTVPRLWTATLPVTSHDVTGNATAVSPDGSTVYVAGTAVGTSNEGYGETVAYNATTGAQIWKATLEPGQLFDDGLSSIAVSPDGAAVFVTGFSGKVGAQGLLQVIIAYNASTGALLWQVSGPVVNGARSPIAVSPDSSAVYVTSSAAGANQTAAYNATTGALIWSDPAGGDASALSADGSALFIAGQAGNGTGAAFTEALSTSTGSQLWQASYGTSANFTAAALSPDGSTLFVAGISQHGSGRVYATAAYSTSAGTQTWVVTASSGNIASTVAGLAETSAGSAVIISESVARLNNNVVVSHWKTIALNPSTGATLWTASYADFNGAPYGGTTATALVLSPDGSAAYVTGFAEDSSGNTYWVTSAYKTASGKRFWTARFNGRTDNNCYAMAVNPSGTQVFVTGNSTYTGTGQNDVMTTDSYSTTPAS
jgi:outer membrane protein assembly factor BamB